MGRMVPMGPIQFSPGEIALLLGVLAVLGTGLALPATATLAYVGARRAARYPGWNALWYWGCGTAIALVVTGGLAGSGLGWWAVPIGWVPVLLLALVLFPWNRHTSAHPDRPDPWVGDPGGELGCGDRVSTGRGSDERAR